MRNSIGLAGAALTGLVLGMASCRGNDGTERDLVDPADAASVQNRWDLAAVEAKLAAAGLHPKRAATVRHSFMKVPATVIAVDSGEVQIFIYASHAEREHDTRLLDPHTVSPPHMSISWIMPAQLVVSDNLAAILLTRHAGVRSHVTHALTR